MPEAEPVALVTGATAGIGLETAIGLARAGMRVILHGRDPMRTEEARYIAADQSGSTRIEPMVADFASLGAVRGVAEKVLAAHDRLDVLVNNAGLIAPRFRLSEDGYELTVAVNHLAPFLLTNLLLDRLRASAPSRIVTVASMAHRGARIDLATLTGPQDWAPLKAYGRSKLCNILFTRALARRLEGSDVTATCLHPGIVATKIGEGAGNVAGFGWRLIKPLLTRVDKGAATSIFLATVPDPTPFHGKYVIGRRVHMPDTPALDDNLAEALWAESARLAGLPA
jgi:retinol dehydrogenase-12